MQPKFARRNGSNGGNISINPDVVFQHMCSHYRRILNAKKTIDTSPPYCYKPRRLNSLTSKTSCVRAATNKSVLSRNISPALTERSLSTNSCKGCWWETRSYTGTSRYHAACVPDDMYVPAKHTCIDMDLVDRIAYDTKNGPSAYCDEGWLDIKTRQSNTRYKSPYEPKKTRNRVNHKRLPLTCSDECRQKRKFAIEIKNEVESEAPSGIFPENCPCSCNCKCRCKCQKICLCNSQERELDMEKSGENSKENQSSSRDSAYNGGVSSVSDSRTPTPDERKKQEDDQKTNCQNDDQQEKMSECCREHNPKENGSRIENNVPQDLDPELEQKKESLRKMKEESLYVNFIQDITSEILEKNLYTNKALKQVMKNHMIANQNVLDENRMKREIDQLKKQLGIPQDNEISNEKIFASSSHFLDIYPVISDSELEASKVKKKTFEITKTNFMSSKENLECTGNLAKSISEVLSKSVEDSAGVDSDEENDEISVIQVARTLREKKKGKKVHRMPPRPSSSHKDSSEDSNPSSCTSIIPNMKSSTISTIVISPEKSESKKKDKALINLKAPAEELVPTILTTNKPNLSVASNLEKKSRNVSFWNTDDLEEGSRDKNSSKKQVSMDYASFKKKEN